MTRLKVASVFVVSTAVVLATAAAAAAGAGGGRSAAKRIFGLSRKWKLHTKPGATLPVPIDATLVLTKNGKGKVGSLVARVTLPLGRKKCKVEVDADLLKGSYRTKQGKAQLVSTLVVKKVQADCSLPGGLDRKLRTLKADLVLTLDGSNLCPKGERPSQGNCFQPHK